ncbi:MAG: FAD-binding oxidoreductase, partial [Myxococcales bacterium]|nr:FAD-binding oxidoreductase [Myxococcales bacterium]
ARGAEEVPIESGGAALEEVRGDFGRIVRGGAQLLVRPRSTLDVRDVVRVANRLGVRVTPRGRGGSTQGQAVARSGIALDLRALNRIALPDSPSGSHVAILEPGGTWDRAIDAIRWRRALSKRYPALQIPLVPGYKKLTVGGTLSVGGGGFRSHTRGLQVDHVCELELVTGAGEIVVASATQNAELFFGSLGGGGQLALITRATTALVPDDVAEGKALASVQLSFDEAEPFLEAILTPRLAERFYEVQGNARYRNGRWSYIIKGAFDQRAIGIDELRRAYPAARLYRNLYLLRSGRHAQLESLGYDLGLKLIRRWRTPHPWATTFLPIEVTAAFFLEQLQRVHRSALGLLGFVTIVPTVSYQRPYSFLQLPRGERFGSFGIFYLPGDRASAEPLWRQLREMQQAADAIGGKAYLSDGLPPTVTDWERHFGDNLERARELKRRYDPGLVLEPLNEAQQELFGGIGSSARR